MSNISINLGEVFFPYQYSKLRELNELSHYTDFGTAIKIFENNELWLSEPKLMNDLSENKYSKGILKHVLTKTNQGKNFKLLCSRLFSFNIDNLVNSNFTFQDTRYIASLSEHKLNDYNGELCMWDRYGRKDGVCIVLNKEPIINGPGHIPLFVSSVGYFTIEKLINHIENLTRSITNNYFMIDKLSQKEIINYLYFIFYFAVVGIKHPSFHDENEWRLIYSPEQAGTLGDYVPIKIESTKNQESKAVAKFPIDTKKQFGPKGVGMKEAQLESERKNQ